jgi:hypothetical protein
VVLPGDALISGEDLTATRALTIQAKAEAVWPWIAQLGQGRGGFYSYDCLENLIGCDIHSADRIVPEWQGIEAGDEVRLARAFGLVVASVERDRSLVLGGGIPLGNAAAPYDFTWASCSAISRTGRHACSFVSATRTDVRGPGCWSSPPKR